MHFMPFHTIPPTSQKVIYYIDILFYLFMIIHTLKHIIQLALLILFPDFLKDLHLRYKHFQEIFCGSYFYANLILMKHSSYFHGYFLNEQLMDIVG